MRQGREDGEKMRERGGETGEERNNGELGNGRIGRKEI